MKLVGTFALILALSGVGSSRKTYKYALSDGKNTYILSDQETPARFAGRRARVTGVLYPKTNILKVERIESVN